MNQGPEAGLFFPFHIFFFVRDFGPLPPKIVGQIRGVFSFEGTLAWVTSPSWAPQNRRLDPPVGEASVPITMYLPKCLSSHRCDQ